MSMVRTVADERVDGSGEVGGVMGVDATSHDDRVGGGIAGYRV